MHYRAQVISVPILAHVVGGGLPEHDAIMLLGPILLILLIVSIVIVSWLAKRGVLGDAERPVPLEVTLGTIAAGLSFGAAAIHLAVIVPHLDEGIGFSAFFLVVGWFQMLWPLIHVLRRTSAIALTALVVNLMVAGIWLVTRTVGMPFGPTPWVPLPIGLVDVVATGLELGIVGLLLPHALPDRRDEPGRQMPVKDALILGAFVLATVALISGYALLSPVTALTD